MKKLLFVMVFLAGACVIGYFYLDTQSPVISWQIIERGYINGDFSITVEDNRGLSEVCVSLSGGSCSGEQRCTKNFDSNDIDLVIEPSECAVNAAPLEIEVSVTAKDSSLLANKSERSSIVIFDDQAPTLMTLSGTRYLKRGGSGVVLYEVGEKPKETGIILDDLIFSSYEFSDNKFLSFYAHPYYVEPDSFKPRIFATDKAGNQKKIRPGSRTASHNYPSEDIVLTDRFLEIVKDKMMASSPKNALDTFLEINNDIRQNNQQQIMQICQETDLEKHWDGEFLRNEGAKKAGFADKRNYIYQSKVVSQQVHTGIDIAGINNTRIVAANSGKVIFTGEIGIYGNVIILDHGYGVHSLYGHLNQINVQRGDYVSKGEAIALSGETGLAFGDHLHFEIRVSGVPVNPIEWFDKEWVKSHIDAFLPDRQTGS